MNIVDRTSAPPLEAGQRLRPPEFHARYGAMPPGTRADDGLALMAAVDRGLSTPRHAEFVADLAARRPIIDPPRP